MRACVSALALLLATALLAFGTLYSRKIYDPDVEALGIAAFHRVPDRQAVIEGTFGGLTRREHKLYFTYDRSLSQGKRKCPT